ncbi:unnamed protein product [Porites evermanni]|uniref:Uncharacterized protein n=1 Tax=Porites evermanni TaxID=104178 RepID=A0ABN8SI52_9CNID|nr:unnamed protein product [Porites evermanni]
MHSASTVVGKVIHYVYTWIPGNAKNDSKEPEKDTRKRKRRVNFSQSVKDQSEITSRIHESFKSSKQLLSTPDGYKVCLHFQRSKAYKEDGVFSQQKFPGCHLEVVGYKFLSNEKKIGKRSALKKWLRQRTNVVHNENFHLDERSHGKRHELCFREVFECSPRLADSRYQRENLGLKGRRRFPRKQWSKETLLGTIDREINGSLVDLNESLSVIRVRPSCA